MEEMLFKNISYLQLWQWSGTICAILVEGVMRNNSVNYFEFGQVVQEEMLFNRFLI